MRGSQWKNDHTIRNSRKDTAQGFDEKSRPITAWRLSHPTARRSPPSR